MNYEGRQGTFLRSIAALRCPEPAGGRRCGCDAGVQLLEAGRTRLLYLSLSDWSCPDWTDTCDRLKCLEVEMTESGRKRRNFPDAFKLEAMAVVHGGRSVAQVAAELGLPDRLVRA